MTRCKTTLSSLYIFTAAILMTALLLFAAPPVETHGRLLRSGNKIVSEKTGLPVQLKGPSLQWSVAGWGSSRFFREETVAALIDGWNAQVIRAPLGVDYSDLSDYGHAGTVTGGYHTEPDSNWARVERVVDATIARGVYAIVDWHSHTAHRPSELSKAIEFFTSTNLAGKYGNHPAVIFEIFNEPVGSVPWSEVKAYADAVIAAIRAAGFDNLILVGNPYWTAAPHVAVADPVVDPLDNYAMTFHFYAEDHRIERTVWWNEPAPKPTYRKVLEMVLDAGIPLFVSEWGTNDASEKLPYNFAEADKWHEFLDEHKISSCAWGVTASDYNVLDYWTSYGNPLNYDVTDIANWTDPANMTAHGRYIYKWLNPDKDTSWTKKDDYPPFTGLRSRIELPPVDSLWAVFNDASSVSLNIGDDNGSPTLHAEFSLDSAGYEWDPYAGASFGVDVSACGYGIGYTYKGSAHTLRPEQSNIGADEGWALHRNSRPTGNSAEWRTVDIPWAYFLQPDWAPVEVPRDVTLVRSLTWYIEAKHGTTGELWVKDIWCLGDPNGEIVSVRRARPNAAARSKTLVRQGRTLRSNAPISLYSLNGKLIAASKGSAGKTVTMSLSKIPSGVYVARSGGQVLRVSVGR